MNKRILYISSKESWDAYRNTFYVYDLKVITKTKIEILETANIIEWIDCKKDNPCYLCGMTADELIIGDISGFQWAINMRDKLNVVLQDKGM